MKSVFRPLALFLCASLLPVLAAPETKPPAKKSPAPTTNAATATPPEPATTNTAAATPSAPAATPAGVTFDEFINDVAKEMSLSDAEKKSIQSAYQNDAPNLQKILNDETLSPLQQAQQVADIRTERNQKISEALGSPDKMQQFLEIEAKYRVALTLLAANGELAPAPAPPAAPASTNAAPGSS